MRTIEEIIKSNLPDDDSYQYDNVEMAMTEYAKEVAFDFAIFIGKCMDGKVGPIKAVMNWEELWNLYQQQKEKP